MPAALSILRGLLRQLAAPGGGGAMTGQGCRSSIVLRGWSHRTSRAYQQKTGLKWRNMPRVQGQHCIQSPCTKSSVAGGIGRGPTPHHGTSALRPPGVQHTHMQPQVPMYSHGPVVHIQRDKAAILCLHATVVACRPSRGCHC